MRHYLDFCARNDITFHAIISAPDDLPWYQQSQRGFGPGLDTDITKPRAGLPMERIADYARSKGVGLRLWVHWKPLSEHLEEAFTQYEKWGLQGLMVDFLDRDDQEMVLFAERVLQSAARHHLHIHFHGVWKPTGLERTYPNLFNHEGVLNLEYLKWSDQCGPEHNLTVPFTRMLAGPMDYTPGGFNNVTREAFVPRFTQPVVMGTRAHQLALYVVYESPFMMVSDYPGAYEGQKELDFIRVVPVTWDETRVVAARVPDYIAVARRKGNEWYLGAITGWRPVDLNIPMSFLGGGQFTAEVYADAADAADNPKNTARTEEKVVAGSTLKLKLVSGGGAAVRIRPAR
jgi:alpha-glucosidase